MKFILLWGSLIIATSNLLCEFTIHIIGDSHVGSFVDRGLSSNHQINYYNYLFNAQNLQIPFIIHWCGPKLMYSFGKDESFVDLNQLNIKNGDICVFVFGEIDIRCHIGKQRDKKNRNLSEILETLAKSYIATILRKKAQFNDLTCIIYNVIPSSNDINNPEYPYYGTLEDRINITKRLNHVLKTECKNNSIIFLDTYDAYSTKEGRLNPDYSDGHVHIRSEYGELIRRKLLALLFETGIEFKQDGTF